MAMQKKSTRAQKKAPNDTHATARCFSSLDAADSRSLRSESDPCMQILYGGLQLSPSADSLGTCVVGSCIVFLWFLMSRSVIVFPMPCVWVAHMQLHASLLHGIRLFCVISPFFASGFNCVFCSICFKNDNFVALELRPSSSALIIPH
jgi:hypothetical protein